MALKKLSRQKFTELFWSLVSKEIIKQKRSFREIADLAGVKRSTFLDARRDKRELSFSAAVLTLRALDIPVWRFTVKLAKDMEASREDISD